MLFLLMYINLCFPEEKTWAWSVWFGIDSRGPVGLLLHAAYLLPNVYTCMYSYKCVRVRSLSQEREKRRQPSFLLSSAAPLRSDSAAGGRSCIRVEAMKIVARRPSSRGRRQNLVIDFVHFFRGTAAWLDFVDGQKFFPDSHRFATEKWAEKLKLGWRLALRWLLSLKANKLLASRSKRHFRGRRRDKCIGVIYWIAQKDAALLYLASSPGEHCQVRNRDGLRIKENMDSIKGNRRAEGVHSLSFSEPGHQRDVQK